MAEETYADSDIGCALRTLREIPPSHTPQRVLTVVIFQHSVKRRVFLFHVLGIVEEFFGDDGEGLRFVGCAVFVEEALFPFLARRLSSRYSREQTSTHWVSSSRSARGGVPSAAPSSLSSLWANSW